MPGTSGNLSVRLDQDLLLTTPTGMSKRLLRPTDMVIVDMEGRLVSGSRNVTSEIGMHLTVYRERPDVEGVVHAHPPIATAFACSGRALDDLLCQEAVMTVGSIPLASFATTGTEEVGASLLPWLPQHDAILLANHGAITAGNSLMDALLKMETLEHVAHVTLVAHQLGSPRPLGSDQLHRLRQAREKYMQKASAGVLEEELVTSS